MIKHKKASLRNTFLILPLVLLLFACKSSKEISKDYLYFQNNLDSLGRSSYKEPVIQTNDLLSIQVFSKSLSQEQAALFNIPNTGAGAANGYLVDMDGNIELPLVGVIKAAGITRKQLSNLLSGRLSAYVKDPSVLVKYLSFKVEVLGEVRTPGTKQFQTDRVTIIDAISLAGDLTDDGKRQDIMVIREEAGGRKNYQLDLRDARIFNSPAYQLQQNDIVYVGATNNKLRRVSASAASQRAFQAAVTLLSLATSVISLVILLTD